MPNIIIITFAVIALLVPLMLKKGQQYDDLIKKKLDEKEKNNDKE